MRVVMPAMGKRILIVSPIPTHPPNAGNRARLLSFVDAFRSLGHEVVLLHVQIEPGDPAALMDYWGDRYVSLPYRIPRKPMTVWRRKLGSLVRSDTLRYALSIDAWYDPVIDRAVRDITMGARFDAVMVEYVFLSRALRSVNGSVKKLLDTHDVFTRRHLRYLQQGLRPRWFSTTRRQEARALARADVVVAIQEQEADVFRSMTDRPVVTIGHTVRSMEKPTGTGTAGRMLFVASDNQINVAAVETFMESVLPRIRERVEDAHLVLAGTVCDHVGEHPGVVKLGVVEDLAETYADAQLVVIPLTMGTGLKIKTAEALGFGRPVLTTDVGAEGLEQWAGTAFCRVRAMDDLAEAAVSLLTDPEQCSRLSRRAREFAQEWNGMCFRAIEELI